MSVSHVNGTDAYSEEKGQRPACFVTHGMCGASNVWGGRVEGLLDQFRCITCGRRRHTRSAPSATPLADQWRQRYAAL